ncbi:hypothetical protein [Streptomyces griseus]|uniref:hypothetical protein n=1 Tax=Streptomyces griseus TaxID=1911 RepID=UPI001112D12D|nr:hypothetical protein [Streptomyces griseus]
MDSSLTRSEVHLRKTLSELEAGPGVQIFFSEEGNVQEELGDVDSMFRMISTVHGIDLDPALARCFMRFDRIACHWRFERPGTRITGEFRTRNLLAVLFARPPEQDWASTPSEERLYSELRVLDDHPGGGSGTFAALRVGPAVTRPEVWYHDFRRGAFELDLDYCAYLAALTVTKGVSGWHYLFADVSLKVEPFAFYEGTLTSALDVLPQLFPEYDYTSLRARLADRTR